VRDAFRALGHDAWSCDLLAAPGNHFQCDVLSVLDRGWDLAIFHPPCTYLTIAAEWAYKDPDFERYPGVGYHQKVKPETLTGADRRTARECALMFVRHLMNAPIPRIALENPKGVIGSRIGPSSQIIQPYDFGDDASKATCLWLKGLPKLTPTLYVPPRITKDGKERWANQTDSGQNRLGPSEDRWAERSLTYQGIADAMADQWSHL
jgi:hypothetical protein